MEEKTKSIEFSEADLANLQSIGQALFQDENDPRSMNYVRKLNRPRIVWWRICLWTLLPPVLLTALAFLLYHGGTPLLYAVLIPCALWAVFVLAFIKRATICLVKIYQRYAPDSIRIRCRFEPSCSEYMILAIEKYGFFNGVKKGIHRLKRCNVHGGGYDYP